MGARFPTNVPQNSALRVLVVDDNLDAATSLADLLEIFGCEAAVAFSGTKGLEVADAFEPDLVFLDLNMRDLSGYEVIAEARRLKSAAAQAFYVCLTGTGDPDAPARAVKAGFDRFVSKPMEAGVIGELMTSALDHTRDHRFRHKKDRP
jgi:CheY-like chemotaxis protein